MANATLIQKKISYGFSKAGKILGEQYEWFRPVSANNPTGATSFLDVTLAQFANDKGLTFRAPATFSTADTWYGFEQDFANIQPGDYLVGPQGTFFLCDFEQFVSHHYVWCNRTISVGRGLDALDAGATTLYSGQAIDNLTPVISNWPTSLRIPGNSGRARDGKMGLPTDALIQFYLVLLPPSVNTFAVFQWNDVVTDDLNRRYVVHGMELTPMGTRLMVEMWPT